VHWTEIRLAHENNCLSRKDRILFSGCRFLLAAINSSSALVVLLVVRASSKEFSVPYAGPPRCLAKGVFA
jgi:hypothetical protein